MRGEYIFFFEGAYWIELRNHQNIPWNGVEVHKNNQQANKPTFSSFKKTSLSKWGQEQYLSL